MSDKLREGKRQQRRMDRRRFLQTTAGAVGALGAMSLSPWTRLPAWAQSTPQGTITIVQGVDAETLHPHVTTSGASNGMMWSIFDRLFEQDVHMVPTPALVTSYSVIDEETWEFQLRKDVFFHNGEPFDAEAVRFSIEHFKDPETRNVYSGLLNQVTDVEIVSPHIVRIHTDGPFGLLTDVLALYCEILPPKAGRNGHNFHQHPIGTGPYRFVRWIPGEVLEVEQAGGHWSGRQPRAQRILWKPIPEASTRLAELRTGAAQLITNVSPLQAASLNARGTRLERMASVGSQFVSLNMLKKPELRDVRVRQALNYAVNKEAIIASLLRGYAVPLGGPFGRGTQGYNPDLKPYPFDPARARALLAEAGYEQGFEMVLTSPNGRYPNDRLVSEAIAQMWTDVGIRTRVETMEWGSFVEGVLGKTHDAFFFLQRSALLDAVVRTNFHSKEQGGPWEGYENAEVDQIIDAAPRILDIGERLKLYQRLSAIVREDAPWVFLYNYEDLYGVADNLAGWQPYPDGVIRLDDMHLT